MYISSRWASEWFLAPRSGREQQALLGHVETSSVNQAELHILVLNVACHHGYRDFNVVYHFPGLSILILPASVIVDSFGGVHILPHSSVFDPHRSV